MADTSRNEAIAELMERFLSRSKVSALPSGCATRDLLLAISAEFRYLHGLRSKLIEFSALLARGYKGITSSGSQNANRRFELSLEQARKNLSVGSLTSLTQETILAHVQHEFGRARQALAELVCTTLGEHVESGVCGEFTTLAADTLARTVFYRPYGPDGIKGIELGEIVAGEKARSLWQHVYEWSIDRTIPRSQQRIAVFRNRRAREVFAAIPWYLGTGLCVCHGTLFTWYAEPLDAEVDEARTIAADPERLLSISFFHYALFHETTRDRVDRKRSVQNRVASSGSSRVVFGFACLGIVLVGLSMLRSFLPIAALSDVLPQTMRRQAPPPHTEPRDDEPNSSDRVLSIDTVVEAMFSELRELRSESEE